MGDKKGTVSTPRKKANRLVSFHLKWTVDSTPNYSRTLSFPRTTFPPCNSAPSGPPSSHQHTSVNFRRSLSSLLFSFCFFCSETAAAIPITVGIAVIMRSPMTMLPRRLVRYSLYMVERWTPRETCYMMRCQWGHCQPFSRVITMKDACRQILVRPGSPALATWERLAECQD